MSETVKVQTVGPEKSIPNKKDPNKPWKSWSLQFEGDPQWYDTFWLSPEQPVAGQELTGTKSFDEKWGYKFELERQGGKTQWNPAAAQATVMGAAASVVNGFLGIPAHYALWSSGSEEDARKLKPLFDKYLVTVETVAKRLKETVVGMGSLNAETQTATKAARSDGDPGPTPPPRGGEDWPPNEEPQNL